SRQGMGGGAEREAPGPEREGASVREGAAARDGSAGREAASAKGAAKPAKAAGGKFDDFEDDIPF
ncbi:MAG TPA: hypothetical protein VF309_05130, partial [Usitatibacter sp.]